MKRNQCAAALSACVGMAMSISAHAANRSEAARDLLQAFQGSCSTQSQWLQLAIDHNDRLRSVIITLRDSEDEACKSARGDLGLIQTYSEALQAMLVSPEHQAYLAAEAQSRELSIAIEQTTETPENAAALAALRQAYASQQVDLAITRANDQSSTPLGQTSRQVAAAQKLGNLMSSMLGQADKVVACLSRTPTLAVQLAANFAALGASFVSPVGGAIVGAGTGNPAAAGAIAGGAAGAGAAVVSQLFSIGAEAIRNIKYERAFWKLDTAILPTALTCGLETMSQFYCDGIDYQTLLLTEADSYPSERRSMQHPIFTGVDILARRLPIFADWIFKVQNGTDPQRTFSAIEKIVVESRRTSVRTTRLSVIAEFNEVRTKLQTAAESDRFTILVNMVADLAQQLSGNYDNGGSGSSNDQKYSSPFTLIAKSRHRYACYLITGLGDGMNDTCPQGDPLVPVEDYIKTSSLGASLRSGGVEAVYKIWDQQIFTKVDALVQAEYNAVVIDDPAAVLDLSSLEKQDRISPRASLLSILTYVKSLRGRYDGEESYLDDTQQMLENTLDALNDPVGAPKDRLTAISTALKLNIGPHLIQERIRNLIKRDFQYQRDHGDLPENISELLRITDGDLLSRLAADGSLNRRRVQDGINEARRVTTNNLEFFRDFFSRTLSKSVRKLARDAKNAREDQLPDPRMREHSQALGRLCAYLAVSGEKAPGGMITSPKVAEICRKAEYYDAYSTTLHPRKVVIGDLIREISGKPPLVRMCALHRQLRKWRIDEIVRRSQPPAP